MPRKTPAEAHGHPVRLGASMRPRPDAAENGPSAAPRAQGPVGASMRPRPDAAENVEDMAADYCLDGLQ